VTWTLPGVTGSWCGNRSSLAAMRVPPIAASYLCLKPRGLMTRQELATTTELKRAAPAFATIRQLTMRFRGILHGRDPDKLESRMDDAHRSGLYGLRRFAYTIRNDLAAVRNAITERWINGQTEGPDQSAQNSEAPDVWSCRNGTAARSTPSVCSRSVVHKLRKTQLSPARQLWGNDHRTPR